MVGGTGANTFTAGPGNMTMVGGGTSDLYILLAGAISNTVIIGFNPNNDFVHLLGFASGAASIALASEKSTSAGSVISLSDGSQITFSGLVATSLTANQFI